MGRDAVTAQQADADQLIAHTHVPLPQASGQSTGHQPAHRAGTGGCLDAASPGPVHRQPLLLFRQQALQLHQRQAGLHRDRQVIHRMVDHPLEVLHAEARPRVLQGGTPVQARGQSCRGPGLAVAVQLSHQLPQLGVSVRQQQRFGAGVSDGGQGMHGMIVP